MNGETQRAHLLACRGGRQTLTERQRISQSNGWGDRGVKFKPFWPLQNEQAYFDNGKQHAVNAGDIAVLVRTGSEGRLIRTRYPNKASLVSTYLTETVCLLAWSAQDIQRLLQAVLTQRRSCVARQFSLRLFALDAASLDELNNDEVVWENVVNEFREYRKLWLQQWRITNASQHDQ